MRPRTRAWADRRGDEMPAWVANKAATAGAHPRGQGSAGGRGARRPRRLDAGRTWSVLGHAGAAAGASGPDGGPPDGRSATSPIPTAASSRPGDGFIAGYNGQIAVDAAHQIIVAQRLQTNPADYAALVPLVDQATANLGANPGGLRRLRLCHRSQSRQPRPPPDRGLPAPGPRQARRRHSPATSADEKSADDRHGRRS